MLQVGEKLRTATFCQPSVKVTMNKLCTRLFIIIFIDVYRKSEYILTVTNCINFSELFYFLQKITALRPSILNF